MPDTSVTVTRTRFANLGVRYYRNVTCFCNKGRSKRRQESWYRFVDLDDDADIGAIYNTKAEIFGDLERFAAERGYAPQGAAQAA